MASVTVFVDDAVRGRMPRVCARTGEPTISRLRLRTTVGSTSHTGVVWLLLLLAGPVGWLIAAFLVARGGGEELAVEVPYSDTAYDELRAARRLRTRGLLVGLLGGGALAFIAQQAGLTEAGRLGLAPAGAVLVVGLLVAGAGALRLWQIGIGVSLDASRRWVTLSGVHPDLAAACRQVAQSEASRQLP